MAVTGTEEVLARLAATEAALQASAALAMAEIMAALEGWAKAEHPYTDRTSNNTNSIRGEVTEVSAQIVRGILSAGMEYSVFLETLHDGKWAFLMPTIQRHKDEIFAIAAARLKL